MIYKGEKIMPMELAELKEEIKKAVNAGDEEAVIGYAELLASQASINEKLFGKTTLLMMSSQFGLEKVVENLLTTYKDKIDLDNSHKYGTALMSAIIEGHPKIASMLIDAGADVNVVNSFGANALGLAEHLGQEGVSQKIKTKGVASLMPEEYASRVDSVEDRLRSHIEQRREDDAIKLIEKMNIKQLNAQIAGNSRSVMFAAYRGCGKVVKALMDRGVDLSVSNIYGNAEQIARANGHKDIANMLQVAVGANGEAISFGGAAPAYEAPNNSFNPELFLPQSNLRGSGPAQITLPNVRPSSSYDEIGKGALGAVALGAVVYKAAKNIGNYFFGNKKDKDKDKPSKGR